MSSKTDRRVERIGRFRSERARVAYLAAYDEEIRRWPVTLRALDVPTRFGPTRLYQGGPATGTPIVLLTGMGGNALGWRDSIGPLAESHPVYAVDPIGGAGHSVQQAPLRHADDLVAWLTDVLDGLDASTAHLVGFSYGGWQALHAGLRAPDRVASLTLLDPAAFTKVPLRHYAWGIAALLTMRSPATLRPRLARWLHTPSLNRWQDFAVALRGPQLYRGHLPPMRPLTDDDLRLITAPTLILLGDRSSIHRARQVKHRLEAVMPSVRVELVPDTGHSLPLDRPELVNARIVEFLAAAAQR